jgi:hypothetical protein
MQSVRVEEGGGAKPGEILSTELSELRTVDGHVASC